MGAGKKMKKETLEEEAERIKGETAYEEMPVCWACGKERRPEEYQCLNCGAGYDPK